MNAKLIVPIMISVLLCCSLSVLGQDVSERKIKRIVKKIERQQERLQNLRGHDYRVIIRDRPDRYRDQSHIIYRDREELEDLRESMRDQREAMRDQMKEMQERVLILKDGELKKLQELKELKKIKELEELPEIDQEKMKQIQEEAQIKIQEFEEQMKAWKDDSGHTFYYKAPNFEFKGVKPYYLTPDIKVDAPNFKGYYGVWSTEDALSIEKELDGETLSSDFSYEVKAGIEGLSLRINGSMKEGQVVITVKKPDGTTFNTYNLSPLADVNWNQKLNFEDQEETSYVGKWTVTVSAEAAEGHYSVRMIGR